MSRERFQASSEERRDTERLRAILRGPSLEAPDRASALARRVLAETTCEDLSWGGDLRLLSGFVAHRLRDSMALRILAASLLVHLLALPPVAYMLLRGADEPEQVITFEGPYESPFGEAEEAEPPVAEAYDAAAGDGSEARGERVESALRRARFVLNTCSVPASAGTAADAPLPVRLLAARGELLSERAFGDWLDQRALLEEAGPLERVLLAEIHVDHWLVTGRRSELLGELVGGLGRAPSDEDEASGRLRGALRERAAAYGLFEEPLAADPLDAPLPLGAAWRAELRRALDARDLAEHPLARAWVE
jgi:hypothetical protein